MTTPSPTQAIRERILRVRSQPNQGWRRLARCRGLDPEVFYPQDDDEGEEAKTICALCVVRQSCLEYALAAREKHGVWGGLSERERRRVLRRRRQSA